MNFKKIKKFLSLLQSIRMRGSFQKKSVSKTKYKTLWKGKNKNLSSLEEDLYSLDEYQLNNLLDKKINFRFYSLDFLSDNVVLASGFRKAQFKTKEEILAELKGQDLNQPIVLICKDGVSSQAFSQKLKEEGFINCYYLKKGFSSGVK